MTFRVPNQQLGLDTVTDISMTVRRITGVDSNSIKVYIESLE